jgi:hypothetical protein
MQSKERLSLVANLSGEFCGHLRKRYTHTLVVALSLCLAGQASAGANFTSKDYAVGQEPAAIVVYDFNRDGGSALPDWLCLGCKPRNAPTDRLRPTASTPSRVRT